MIDSSVTCAPITARAFGAGSHDSYVGPQSQQNVPRTDAPVNGPVSVGCQRQRSTGNKEIYSDKPGDMVQAAITCIQAKTRDFIFVSGTKRRFILLPNREKLSAFSGCVTGRQESDSRIKSPK